MEIHFWTDQTKFKALYGKYYIPEEIEFIPNKVVVFYLNNSFDDSLMGEKAIGYSGIYHWVFSPEQFILSSLSSRKAKIMVDSIFSFKSPERYKVDFEVEIGIDSMNIRYPTFCYSWDAQQINYGMTFEAFRQNKNGKWIEASEFNNLNIRYTTLGPTCDLSKVVDDDNAHEYFKFLKHRFSIYFTKPGTYKMVSKYDTLINTIFTIKEK